VLLLGVVVVFVEVMGAWEPPVPPEEPPPIWAGPRPRLD